MCRSRAQSGFTLLEALLAATLLTFALLLGMALVLEQPRIVRRLDAQRRALQILEETVEEMRAGGVPLATRRIDWPKLYPSDTVGVELWTTVEPAGYPPGLYDVSLRVVWTMDGQIHQRRLETMVFRP